MEKGQTGICTAQGKDSEEWEDTFCPNTGLITRIKNVTNGNDSRTKLDYTSEIHRGHRRTQREVMAGQERRLSVVVWKA